MRSRHLSRTSYAAAALAMCVALSACYHSTQLAATWRDPGVDGPLHFRKPIAVFVSNSDVFRRMMEDKIAGQLMNGTPSYRVIKGEVTDGAKIRERLADAGYDGAVIMRVVDVQNLITYTPGTYWYGGPPYSTFAGYWGTAWGYPYDPAYVTEDKVVSIETQIYSLKNDKLLWAARSETTNPRSVSRLGDSVIRHVIKELHKEGLMAAIGGCLTVRCPAATLAE